MNLKDGTETSRKLTKVKDKIHVEELRLPEIMMPITKTKGNNTCRNVLSIFFCSLSLLILNVKHDSV